MGRAEKKCPSQHLLVDSMKWPDAFKNFYRTFVDRSSEGIRGDRERRNGNDRDSRKGSSQPSGDFSVRRLFWRFSVPQKLSHEIHFSDGRTVLVDLLYRKGAKNQPTILLLPGLDDRAETWRGVMQSLIDGPGQSGQPDVSALGVLAISMRGQGLTLEREIQKYGTMVRKITYSDQVDLIHSVLRHLNIRDVHVVGHSYGGAMALTVAIQRSSPFNVLSLNLITPYVTNFERFGQKSWMDKNVFTTLSLIESINPVAYRVSAQQFMPLFFSTFRKMGKLSQDTSNWTDAHIQSLSAMTVGLMDRNSFHDAKELAPMRIPTQLLACEHDELIPLRAMETFFQAIPEDVRGNFTIRTDVGHRCTIEDPVGIAEWLAKGISQANRIPAVSSVHTSLW